MRGLSPPPADVAHLKVDILADTARSSVGFWLFSPFWPTALMTDIVASLALLNTAVVQLLTSCMANAGSVDVLRLTVFGSAPYTFVTGTAPNAGAWGGMQANNVCTDVYWITADTGKRGQGILHIPAFPDDFTSDHLTTNDTCQTNVRNAAADWLNAVPTCAVGTLSSLAPCVLRRSRFGTPLVVPQVSFISAAVVTTRIGRVSRRLYVNR